MGWEFWKPERRNWVVASPEVEEEGTRRQQWRFTTTIAKASIISNCMQSATAILWPDVTTCMFKSCLPAHCNLTRKNKFTTT